MLLRVILGSWTCFSSVLQLAWALDLALSSNAAAFLQHPVVGGPSYDAVTFGVNGPVYTGSDFWPWVVNGFIFEFEPGNVSALCVLAGEYPRNYWDASHPSRMRSLISTDGGASFTVGPIVVAGNASLYDKGGSTPDGSAVVDGPVTRLVYDWTTPTNDDGGLGYAEGQGVGPFVRGIVPLVSESTMPPLPLPQYKRVYGGTLIRRGDNDWLVLAAISTAHNAGGTWGMCCLTSASAEGPWSEPTLLLTPQSSTWHAHPTEFYPAFVDGVGFVYAPATSISSNRNYQLLWRAPLASAHYPSAWVELQDGSLFHWEGGTGPGMNSIWGQTFSAALVRDSTLLILYPSLSSSSIGSLGLARVPWVPTPGGGGSIAQRTRGFFVSAPVADSLALTSGSMGAAVVLNVTLAAMGPALMFSLVWSVNSPVGGDTWPFPGGMDPRTGCDLTTLALAPSGFRLLSLPPGSGCVARAVPIASGPGCGVILGEPLHLYVSQSAAGRVNITCNGAMLLSDAFVLPPGGATQLAGRAGIYAAAGTSVNVTAFDVQSGWLSSPAPLSLLAADAMAGAGNLAAGWRTDVTEGLWRFGDGLICDASAACEHFAKWNFVGVAVTLWTPRGIPGVGNITVSVDGAALTVVDLAAPQPTPSAPVWNSGVLLAGHHALTVRAYSVDVGLPVDSIDVSPVSVPDIH